MPVERIYRKKLCMTEFEIHAFSCDSSLYFDAASGQPNASFFYVEAGAAVVVSDGQRLEMGEGDLFSAIHATVTQSHSCFTAVKGKASGSLQEKYILFLQA